MAHWTIGDIKLKSASVKDDRRHSQYISFCCERKNVPRRALQLIVQDFDCTYVPYTMDDVLGFVVKRVPEHIPGMKEIENGDSVAAYWDHFSEWWKTQPAFYTYNSGDILADRLPQSNPRIREWGRREYESMRFNDAILARAMDNDDAMTLERAVRLMTEYTP